MEGVQRADRDAVEAGREQPLERRRVEQVAVRLQRDARVGITLAAGRKQVERHLQLHQWLTAGEDEAVRLLGQVGEHGVGLGRRYRRCAGSREVVAVGALQIAVVGIDPVDRLRLHAALPYRMCRYSVASRHGETPSQ